jgi:Zn-dependent peptidase ImmA (M78 family)
MYECTCVAVNVWMPEDLIKRVRTYTGAAKFDRYIVAAVAERLRLELMDELSAYLEAEFGPLDNEKVAQAAKLWTDIDED